MSQRIGILHGVGLGPGDPELMTVRAHRLIRETRHIAFFRKPGRAGHARALVDGLLADDFVEVAMEYPVTTEIPVSDPRYNELLSAFYEDVTQRLLTICRGGDDVVVLCEGDPFFFGSFMHIHSRVKDWVPVDVVPGVTGMSGAWTASGVPITWGDDVLTVLMGTLPEADLAERIAKTDALVVMKVGRNLPKVRAALERAGRFDDAWLVESATMTGERVAKLSDVGDHIPPYFSIVLVHGQGRRP